MSFRFAWNLYFSLSFPESAFSKYFVVAAYLKCFFFFLNRAMFRLYSPVIFFFFGTEV
jgi:hypothetical protein